jgi:hypothetical protein
MEDRICDIIIILGILTVIILKITNVITISWFWLLSPLWIIFGLGTILAILITISCLIHMKRSKKK